MQAAFDLETVPTKKYLKAYVGVSGDNVRYVSLSPFVSAVC